MSAPWEVWVHSPTNGQAAYATTEDAGTIYVLLGPMKVRYLRDDLYCEECARFYALHNNSDSGCPHDHGEGCDGPTGMSAACMAFVPREEQP